METYQEQLPRRHLAADTIKITELSTLPGPPSSCMVFLKLQDKFS